MAAAQIKDSEDLIREFRTNVPGRGIMPITKKITGEDLVESRREHGSKKNYIDIVARTPTCRVGYEIWAKIPTISNVLQKLNDRRDARKEITHWVAVIPHKDALTSGSEFGYENIYVVSWDTVNNTRPVDFSLLEAFSRG